MLSKQISGNGVVCLYALIISLIERPQTRTKHLKLKFINTLHFFGIIRIIALKRSIGITMKSHKTITEDL
jgi:hypothetical protein